MDKDTIVEEFGRKSRPGSERSAAKGIERLTGWSNTSQQMLKPLQTRLFGEADGDSDDGKYQDKKH